MALVGERPLPDRIGQHPRDRRAPCGRCRRMSAQPLAHDMLGDVRQIFLQVAVGACRRAAGCRGARALSWRTTLICRATPTQRVFGRLIAVRGRIGGGPLDVGIVIRRAGAEVYDLHAELARTAPGTGTSRSGRIRAGCAGSRRRRSGKAGSGRNLRARPGRACPAGTARGSGLNGHEIKGAQADAELDLVPAGANGGHDVAQQPGAVLEGAAVFAGPREGAEELRAADSRGNA